MFEADLPIQYMALGPDASIKPRYVLEMFQDIAVAHADSLGIGVAGLRRRGLTWVMKRYTVFFDRAIAPGTDRLHVRTWFEPGKHSLVSLRQFDASDADGPVARGMSMWILLDLERERPARLDRDLGPEYFDNTDPTDGVPTPEKLPALESAAHEIALRCRRSDLDMNGHANHTVYIDLATESLPDEIAETRLERIDIEYMQSIMRDEVISRRSDPRDGEVIHELASAGGAVYAKLITHWEHKK